MKDLFLFLVLAGVLAACKKPADSGTVQPPPPPPPGSGKVITTEVGQPTGAVIIKTIGNSGGSISSADGKVTLNIPAGALDKNETISMEPIQNKAPMGMQGFAYRFLPHGLQFKKPALLSVKYDDRDVVGTAPELLKIATQLDNRAWKKLPNITLDKTHKTVTAELNHFSDYSVYTSFRLKDLKTKSDTAVIHMSTTEEVKFDAIEEIELDDSLTLPTLAAGYVREWAINGKAHPLPSDNLGSFGGKNGYSNAERDYLAPRREPDPDTVAISAKLDLGSKGALWLVRTVVIDDINKLVINGKLYDKAIPAAVIVPQANHLSFGMQQRMPNGKFANISVSINEIFDVTEGTYSYNASEKVKILAEDEFGHDWSSERTLLPSGTKEYSGRVQISVIGTAPKIYLIGTVTGSLFGVGNTTNNGPVDVVFAVMAN